MYSQYKHIRVRLVHIQSWGLDKMTTDYIHGFSAPEQDRLTAVQEILNKAELRELDLVGVRSILDVGALASVGSGQGLVLATDG